MSAACKTPKMDKCRVPGPWGYGVAEGVRTLRHDFVHFSVFPSLSLGTRSNNHKRRNQEHSKPLTKWFQLLAKICKARKMDICTVPGHCYGVAEGIRTLHQDFVHFSVFPSLSLGIHNNNHKRTSNPANP